MPHRRTTLARIMMIILLVAFVFAAIRDNTSISLCLTFNVMAATLMAATIAAKFAPGPDRAWWFGFAAFGWANFVLGSLKESSGYFGSQSIIRVLVIQFAEKGWQIWGPFMPNGMGGNDTDKLVTLASIPAGLLGGLICQTLAKRCRIDGSMTDDTRNRTFVSGPGGEP